MFEVCEIEAAPERSGRTPGFCCRQMSQASGSCRTNLTCSSAAISASSPPTNERSISEHSGRAPRVQLDTQGSYPDRPPSPISLGWGVGGNQGEPCGGLSQSDNVVVYRDAERLLRHPKGRAALRRRSRARRWRAGQRRTKAPRRPASRPTSCRRGHRSRGGLVPIGSCVGWPRFAHYAAHAALAERARADQLGARRIGRRDQLHQRITLPRITPALASLRWTIVTGVPTRAAAGPSQSPSALVNLVSIGKAASIFAESAPCSLLDAPLPSPPIVALVAK